MGHFLFSVYGSDLVQRLDGRRQATVHTEDLHKQEGVDHTDGPYYASQQSRGNLCFQCGWHEEIPVTYLTLPSMIAERDK